MARFAEEYADVIPCNEMQFFMFTLEGLHEKHRGETWSLDTNTALVLGTRKTTKTLVELARRRTPRIHRPTDF
jgi:hypothetical protein